MIVINIFIGLLGLGLVVVVHEYGHLLAAKSAGIGVDVFSLGWGRKLVGRRIGETEYRVSLFPIGGFVRLRGERALLEAHQQRNRTIEDIPGGFFSANSWKRVIVALGGPLANVVMALIIFTIINMAGYYFETFSNRIVLASSLNTENGATLPAEEAGLQDGDRIVMVGEIAVNNFNEIREQIFIAGTNPTELIYMRNNQQYRTSITPRLDRELGIAQIGIYPWVELEIAEVVAESAAAQAGLQSGDYLVAVNGLSVANSIEFFRAVNTVSEATIGYQRRGIVRETQLIIDEGIEEGLRFAPLYERKASLGPVAALGEGLREIRRILRYTIIGIGSLFGGAEVTNVVAGPIRLTTTIGEVATNNLARGLGTALRIFFNFLALLSIALAFMNMLPIPVLDGGQIILYLIEGCARIRFSPRFIVRYQLIGSIMIAALIVLALTSDALYLFRR